MDLARLDFYKHLFRKIAPYERKGYDIDLKLHLRRSNERSVTCRVRISSVFNIAKSWENKTLSRIFPVSKLSIVFGTRKDDLKNFLPYYSFLNSRCDAFPVK